MPGGGKRWFYDPVRAAMIQLSRVAIDPRAFVPDGLAVPTLQILENEEADGRGANGERQRNARVIPPIQSEEPIDETDSQEPDDAPAEPRHQGTAAWRRRILARSILSEALTFLFGHGR